MRTTTRLTTFEDIPQLNAMIALSVYGLSAAVRSGLYIFFKSSLGCLNDVIFFKSLMN